jgi:glycosyltransferase involved in cell wall biosynthesis
LRLGFHYHIPAEQRLDGIYMPGYLSRFVDSLAAQCEQVICYQHSPRPSQVEILDSRIKQPNVKLVSIGQHCAAWKRSLRPGRFVHALQRETERPDALLVRGPSPLLPGFCAMARKLNIPTALLLVGSYVDGVDDLPQPRWRKELIRLYGNINQGLQDRAAAHSLTFVNSRKLYERNRSIAKRLVETRTTTLSEQDFFERDDTCQDKPIRLLYTGRYTAGKGLLEMVEALALLVNRGHDVVLDLVGWPEPGDPVVDELMTLADRLKVRQRVTNHGRKSVGPELFAYYRQADIYVIASKLSEGFPRTIWEAMAHSLPVVATSVGSIPQFIGDAAEIVEPGRAQSLAVGIERVITTADRRQAAIRAGLALARANTLEARAVEVLNALQNWLEEGKG